MRFSNEYGFCELNPFPGCKWLAVSNYAYVYPGLRGQGHGAENHRLRLKRAKELGYNALICTVNSANAAEIHILSAEGWSNIGSFETHDKTTILIFLKTLR